MDLRTGSPAAERRTWSRSLRGAILARPSPSCAHDDDRVRLPPASPPRNSKAGKKESAGHHLSRLCRPCATPSSNSSLGYRRSGAHIAENGFATSCGVNRSAKVVLGRRLIGAQPEPLDQIALAVEPLAEAGLPAPVALGRDVRGGTLLLNQFTDAVGIVGLVRQHDGARAKMVKQCVGDLPVMHLSCRQAEPDREALRVDNDMDLGREPAA